MAAVQVGEDAVLIPEAAEVGALRGRLLRRGRRCRAEGAPEAAAVSRYSFVTTCQGSERMAGRPAARLRPSMEVLFPA